MGIKTFERTVQSFHTATCRSEIQATRLYEVVRKHRLASDVTRDRRAVKFWWRATCAGNSNDDLDTAHRVLCRKANVDADWTVSQTRRDPDRPRPFEEIEAAVRKSRRNPPKIEGSAGIPARPIIDRLRALGYVVTS